MKSKLRVGQDLFNFLEWAHTVKGEDTNQSIRMADPFYWSDKKWKKLYDQYSFYRFELPVDTM